MTIIETERLQLRYPMTDVNLCHLEWLSDKNLMRWSDQRYREHTPDSQQRFLTDAYARNNPLCFDIQVKLDYMTGSIGSIHAHLDRRHKRADLGIMLGPDYHGKGYAREAWLAVEGLLHVAEDIIKFEAGCVKANTRMTRLLDRMNYYEEGHRPMHFQIDGQSHDLLLYGKLIAG